MAENNMDKRVQFTRRILSESLLALLKEKPIARVTVKELCAMADINRGTFYAHFIDPQDLLSQICEDASSALHRRLDACLASTPHPDAITLWKLLLHTFRDKQGLFHPLLSIQDSSLFFSAFRTFLSQRFLPLLGISPSLQSPVNLMTLEFCCAGCAAMIERWVLTGCKVPVEDMAVRLSALAAQALKYELRIL